MQFTIDDSAIRDIERQLATVGKAFTPAVLGQIMTRAAQPMLTAVQDEAPVRTGATVRDARIRVVPAAASGESIRVLIGISKRRGKVGYRTRFRTQGTRFQSADDFLSRAETKGLAPTVAIFAASCQTVVSRILTRFR